MASELLKSDFRVLLLAPTKRDAEAIQSLLVKLDIDCVPQSTMDGLCHEMRSGAGVVIVSEESLAIQGSSLADTVSSQPVWSDLPIIVLSRTGVESATLTGFLGELGNTTVLERPVRISTFQSVVTSALRARSRQYEVRDHLIALEQVESALRGSRQQLQLVVKGANVGIWQCPLPLADLTWDETTKSHFFLSPDADVTIDTFFARLHPDDRERTQEAITRSIESRDSFEIEYRTVDAQNDRSKWIRALGRAVYDEGGNAIEFNGITIDVTERKRAEQELHASEERLRLAVQTGKLGVWELDPNTNSMACSTECKANFGRGPDEPFTYEDLWNSIHPDDFDRVRIAANRSITDHIEYDIEYRNIWPDGSLHWVLARAFPTYDADDNPVKLIGVTLDITDRKTIEENRAALLEAERAARSEAERTSQMKDEFLATLSHELRTPLNAILGWAQILSMTSATREDIAHGVEVIERNARAQAQIIEDLLDMSRIISGKVRLDIQRIDLAAVIAAAIGTVQPAAHAKEIKIQTSVDSRAATINGDPNRLQQVFWNLLTNAIKFTPKQGHVQLALQHVDSRIQISVSDNGEGIDPEFLPFVFDRFRQANATTTRQHGGLGIGLSIVKQLVESHGGTISVQSDGHEKGTTFTVTLPISAVQTLPATYSDRESSSKLTDPPEKTRSSVDLSGVTVLVVDDEPDARFLVQRLLQDFGASVITAGSSREAVQIVQIQKPSIMISDISMPEEDGYTLIRKVRAMPLEDGGRTPAVALTAYARDEDRVSAIIAGFQHHLTKPVEPAELIAIVSSLTGRSSST